MLTKQKQTKNISLFYVDLCLLWSYDVNVKKINKHKQIKHKSIH